tara:strand:- start:6 stop:995 length:990 start_codon:yes stop_codon:yes gene_type:complete
MDKLNDIWAIGRNRFLKKKYNETLSSYNFTKQQIDNIISRQYINVIEKFYLTYTLNNKSFINYNNTDNLIKVKSNNQIIAYHPNTLEKHLDINGMYDIVTKHNYKMSLSKILKRKIKAKTNYSILDKFNKYEQIDFYINKNSSFWEFDDILNILESRGLNKIPVTEDMFSNMIDLDPGVYAIEFIDNELQNVNKAYCSFQDFPTEDDYLTLPTNILTQLKTNSISSLYYRIVKPLKGISVKLKCFINPLDKFIDIKEQLQIEFTKHKFISINQIVSIESDINHSLIPFLITETKPSGVIDVTDIDLEISFDENFGFENEYEALLIYLNS